VVKTLSQKKATQQESGIAGAKKEGQDNTLGIGIN
jgi:hypothetical protein